MNLHIQLSHIKSMLNYCERGDAAIVRLGRQNVIVNLVTLLEAHSIQHLLKENNDHLLDGHFTMNLISSAPDISESDREMIEQLVDLRNSIVHGDGCKKLSIAEVRECLKLAETMLKNA